MSIVFEFMQVVKKWQKYIVYDGVIPPSLVSIWNNQTTHIMWNMFVSFCGLSSSSSCHVQFMGLISFQLQISTNFQRLWKGSNYHTLFNKDLPFTLSNEAAEFEIILLNQKITAKLTTIKHERKLYHLWALITSNSLHTLVLVLSKNTLNICQVTVAQCGVDIRYR